MHRCPSYVCFLERIQRCGLLAKNSSFMSIFESENVSIPPIEAILIVLQIDLGTEMQPMPYFVCPAKKQPMQHKISRSKSLQEGACN